MAGSPQDRVDARIAALSEQQARSALAVLCKRLLVGVDDAGREVFLGEDERSLSLYRVADAIDWAKRVVGPDEPRPFRFAAVVRSLRDFCGAVDAAGGVAVDDAEAPRPAGCEEWSDLGYAYLDACRALGRPPKIVDAPAADAGEDSVVSDDMVAS